MTTGNNCLNASSTGLAHAEVAHPRIANAVGAGADITLRIPEAGDGVALHRLVADCPPLDANSLYCNLLHCTHFAATSVIARQGDRIAGFISGYRVPDDLRTLFVWQVAVAPSARKRGLARRMLLDILSRPACRDVQYLHTTITPDNQASRVLFTALARSLDAPLMEQVWFERQRHFDGAHADEILLQIGPFNPHHARANMAGSAPA